MPQGLSSLLAETVVQIAALLAFGLGLGTFATRRLALPSVFLPVLVFASASLQAYLLFFVWFVSAPAATLTTRLVCAASLGWAVWQFRAGTATSWTRDSLIVAAQFVLLSYGFLLVLGAMPAEPRVRFHVPLAIDHLLPRLLADRFYLGQFRWVTPQPALGHDYLASDRPPLVATMVLVMRTLLPAGREVAYQVTATLCQMGWVLALYALAAAYRLRREARAFLLVGVACSGFALLNSVYTWPKLMAGSLFATGLAVAFHDDRARAQRLTSRLAVAVGLGALGMLAHNSPVFSILAAPGLLFSRLGRDYLKPASLTIALLVGISVLAPWLAYTKILDPPGNRLVKMHLAGVPEIDPRGAVAAIRDQYATSSLRDLAWARVTNVGEQWLTYSGRGEFAPWLQWQQFFHIIPTLGAFGLGLLALIARRRVLPNAIDVTQIGIYVLATWVIWIVLMFMPNTAILHHSSYANILLLFVLGSLGLTLLPRRVGALLLILHVALFAAGWLQLLGPWTGIRVAWLDLGALMIAAFAGLAWLPLDLNVAGPDARPAAASDA